MWASISPPLGVGGLSLTCGQGFDQATSIHKWCSSIMLFLKCLVDFTGRHCLSSSAACDFSICFLMQILVGMVLFFSKVNKVNLLFLS